MLKVFVESKAVEARHRSPDVADITWLRAPLTTVEAAAVEEATAGEGEER